MPHTTEDHGAIIYTEERDILGERLKYLSLGIFLIAFILLIVYSGSLHSRELALLAFILFGCLLYPGITSIMLGLNGIRQLTVYETGFMPPYCTDFSLNFKEGGFVHWREVAGIYSNKNLRVSKLFPYIVVELRDSTFSFPAEQIINVNLFLNSVKPFTKVITETELRPGIIPVEYYPPSTEARLDDDAIVLKYGERDVRFPFDKINKIRVKMSYQLQMEGGSRIGLLGMGREDIERIRENRKKFLDSNGSPQSNSRDGLLQSSSDDTDGEDEQDEAKEYSPVSGERILNGLLSSSSDKSEADDLFTDQE